MKKLVLSGLLFGSFAMALTTYNFMPYAGHLNYSGNTNKDNGYVGGIYISAFESPWKTEIDLEHTEIKYKDSSPRLKQSDATLLIHYYEGYDLAYKMGVHYIDSRDTLTDNSKIYMAGILYYKTLRYNLGVDFYYSDYSNQDDSPKIYQASPKLGFNFGNYYSMLGSFYFETKFDYIKPGHNQAKNNLEDSYKSYEFTLNNYNGAFTTSLNVWNGHRIFAVENDGFIVNNISDEQTGGFKVSENYNIDKMNSLKLEYSYTEFLENNLDADVRNVLVSYNHSF